MADISQQELSEPHTNGVVDGLTEEEKSKMRPADIDADMREMERRKRVELIMNSKMFKEELERIIETQLKDGSGPSGLLQQISDMMGAQGARFNSNVFKNSNCVVPINDIRGVEAKGYERGEKVLRCKLAAVFRLLDLYGWTQSVGGQITARLNQDQEHFLVNPYGLLYHEVTASSLVKVDMQGQVVEQGTTNFGVHVAGFQLHSTIHAARPDVKCIIHITTPTVTAVSSLKSGILPLGQESIVIGEVSTHQYIGEIIEPEEREKITRNLGPINKVMLLTNRGALCCGETIEEAFYNVYNTVLACETQLKLMPVGLDNLNLLTEETKKAMFEASRKPPQPPTSAIIEPSLLAEKLEKRWRIGGTEFEALMRMLDNAGFRTGYIYRHPLIKSEPPKPRNDVEVPPAVSSLGYLLEEEELYKQGLWKGGRKGTDRSRWLNSPNVYQKVEILETGTPDPKKITKWVSDGSPTHSSTPVRIESALQFVPKNTNPKEFKQLQQQIKDYRRAEKISAGPQSHILEGVSWEEAKKMQDATISGTGEQVVLVGAASKGIIQRGFQHNAMVYKTPYAKNPFDAVTDQELDQYKKEVERKNKGDIYDESQSESEALSSFNISRATHESSTAKSPIQSPISVTSETEEESRDEPRVLRIEKKHVPVPSQAEVVLSDGNMHAHDNNKTANTNVAVMEASLSTFRKQQHYQPPMQKQSQFGNIIKHQELTVDTTTEFLNEMRRSAIDSRNDSKRDDSSNANSENEVQRAWCRAKAYEDTHLEVVKTLTIAGPLTPILLNNGNQLFINNSNNNENINISNNYHKKNCIENENCKELSPRISKRQFFYDQYDSIYAAYKNWSHEQFNVEENKPTCKHDDNLLEQWKINSRQSLNTTLLHNNDATKQLVAKYSSTNHNNNCDKFILKVINQNRKRSLGTDLTVQCSFCKVPKLILSHATKMEDLESPRLVEAAMNTKNIVLIEDELKTSSQCVRQLFENKYNNLSMIDKNIGLNANYSFLIKQKVLPKIETTEVINAKDINGNDKITNDILQMNSTIQRSDENGNSTFNDNKTNDISPLETSPSSERDQSSAEDASSQQTVVEKSLLNIDMTNNQCVEMIEDIKNESDYFYDENPDWLKGESIEELEHTFHREINQYQPWRYSSPISKKHYQREDSMTEVINSINVNLTPSKSFAVHSLHLPDTDISMKYNLNSTHMSVLYSLTPTTTDIEQELSTEHFNCGQDCPQCVMLGGDIAQVASLSSESIHDEQSLFIWDDPVISIDVNKTATTIDLNKTIDLFDNSIEMDTGENSRETFDGYFKDERTSLGGSDLLELPHSTVAELNQCDDVIFQEVIATSVNEIIAGLGEREALIKASDIVDDVIDIACRNLEAQSVTNIVNKQNVDYQAQIDIKIEKDSVKEEICEIIHKITENSQEKTASYDFDNKDDQFIVIDELIHHIIEKESAKKSDTISRSSDSFNAKKVKESVNSELKEIQSNFNNDTESSNAQNTATEDSSHEEEVISEVHNESNDKAHENITANKEKFINKIKQIVDNVDATNMNEVAIKEEFRNIIEYIQLNDYQLCADNTEAFQHNLNQLKFIINQSTDSLNDVLSAEIPRSIDPFALSNFNSIDSTVTQLDTLRQCKNRCKKIVDDQDASNENCDDDKFCNEITDENFININKYLDGNIKIENDEKKSKKSESLDKNDLKEDQSSSMAMNISSDNELQVIESQQVADVISITNNENTESPSNKEENEITTSPNHMSFCLIEYEDTLKDVDKNIKNEENSESDISDTDIVQMWNAKETEMELSYNEIRSNDEASYILFEVVDDLINDSNKHNLKTIDNIFSGDKQHTHQFKNFDAQNKHVLSVITEESEYIESGKTDEKANLKEIITDNTEMNKSDVSNKLLLDSILEVDKCEENSDINNDLNTSKVASCKNERPESGENSCANTNPLNKEDTSKASTSDTKGIYNKNEPPESDEITGLFDKTDSSKDNEYGTECFMDNLSDNLDSHDCDNTNDQSIIILDGNSSKVVELINLEDEDSGKDESIGKLPTDNFYLHQQSVASPSDSAQIFEICKFPTSRDSNEDDVESRFSTNVNRETETSTMSQGGLESTHDANDNADISNIRKSDFITICNLNDGNATFNMADVNEDSIQDKSKSVVQSKRCSVCLKLFTQQGSVNDSHITYHSIDESKNNDDLSDHTGDIHVNDEICSNCVMTFSMDTRDFIRLERQVIGDKAECDSLSVSPLKTPPKYEDTTLCQVVTKINLTDSVGSNDNNNSSESIVNI